MRIILPASSPEDLNKCLKVRRTVFTEEMGVSETIEVDEQDKPGSDCIHFLISEDQTPVGAFRISINENNVARLQRFCVLKEYRGSGYGSYALEFLEGFCESQGVKKIVLDAKCSSADFYKKCGFETFSDEFIEAGVLHVKMKKKL